MSYPRRNFTDATCPNCGTLHLRVPVEYSRPEPGEEWTEGVPDLDTQSCHDDECRVRLCASCPQFSCYACGLAHCRAHGVVLSGELYCRVCAGEMVAEGAAEYQECA